MTSELEHAVGCGYRQQVWSYGSFHDPLDLGVTVPVTASLPGGLLATLDELDYLGHEGLLTVTSEHKRSARDYIWRDLRSKVGLDAAFFHDGVPLVGFTAQGRGQGLAALRKRLWNYGRVPLLLSANDDDVIAFSGVDIPTLELDEPSELAAYNRRSSTARELLAVFGRLQVQAGTFRHQYGGSFATASRVDKALLSNLDFLRKTVAAEDVRQRPNVDKVIAGCLVATYLAHRGILTGRHFLELAGQPDLDGILEGGMQFALPFFVGLAERFNGDVFGPVPDALRSVDPQYLRMISSFLDGDDLPSGQRSLYPYDFSVLPSDLVSSIYEQLLEQDRRTQGAYYTPRFLVDMVLDEVLPWNSSTLPKLIDLACGSGAFMTEAFRRLVYQERLIRGRRLSYDELQQLLTNHIFGIERNLDAARIAAFGLYLAFLEELDPPTVWDNTVLPILLNRNLVIADAFENHELSGQKFDAVVGNPPWYSELTTHATKFVEYHQVPVADKQIAQAFLWLAREYLSSTGTLGLVMPAKPLLHNRSNRAVDFRTEVFSQLQVRALVDLSAVRRNVFTTAIAPAAVIVANARSQETARGTHEPKEIIHIAAHPRAGEGAFDVLQIVPEEVRTVSARQAEERPDIWKVLLWGSLRDLQFLDWLRASFPSVGEVARQRNWVTGQGYQPSGGGRYDASHMHGMKIIRAPSVLPLCIRTESTDVFDRPYLHRPRNPQLFRGPHTLVRTTFVKGRLAAALVDEDAVFQHGVMGFAGPTEDRHLLAMLAGTLVSSLGQYFHFMTSAAWGVERDFVELNEHLSLPLATPDASQYARLNEIFREAARGLTDEGLHQLDELVFEVYGLTEAERLRVRNSLEYGLERFRRPASFYSSVTDHQLEVYLRIVHSTLSEFLGDMHVSGFWQAAGSYRLVGITIRHSTDATGTTFGSPIDVEAILDACINRDPTNTGVVAQPAGFFLDSDTVYIVKTEDKDRWSPDAALDDTDRIIATLAAGDVVA